MTVKPEDFPYRLVLGSGSPRREELLKKMGFYFDIVVKKNEEIFPQNLPAEQVPEYIAKQKSQCYNLDEMPEKTLLITADTLVILDGKILGKPKDKSEAIAILKELSGKTHEVVTGVCLRTKEKEKTFSISSYVSFRVIKDEEILYYVENYKPYDKAGAYGIQEWLGFIALERIEGSFFNVMGFPTQRLYVSLMEFDN
ncbi:MAG: Maf family nucleotide pyrophosphatase [Bacteroidales bacterium]|jgi:septum formation protein|nr:Maf family nucleotide pyrophosphatase [Bacteroidales bacterium]